MASAQAEDGQELTLYYSRYGHTADDLPKDDELIKEAGQLAEQLDGLRKAPLVENYTGPVLFEGDGAVGAVRYSLATNLSGTPVPIGVGGRDAVRFGGALTDRIGLPVIAKILSLVDDPSVQSADKTALIGGYRIDDEGVPSQKVDVIKNGELKTLLMSRTPSAKSPRATATPAGHAGGVYGQRDQLWSRRAAASSARRWSAAC